MSLMDYAMQQHFGMLNQQQQEPSKDDFDIGELTQLAKIFLTAKGQPGVDVGAQDPATAFLQGGQVQDPTMQQPSQYQPGQITPPAIPMPQPGQIPGMGPGQIAPPQDFGGMPTGQMMPGGPMGGMPGQMGGISPQMLKMLMARMGR